MEPTIDRIPRRLWIGLVAAAVYVAFAAGGGALIDALGAADADPVVELALTHLLPLPIAIALGLAFVRWAGWWKDVWTDPPVRRSTPRRLWWWLVPAAIALQPLALVLDVHWSRLTVAFVLVGAIVYLIVGLGEEFFFRGILLESVRARHGETVTLLVTALAFGFAHSFGSLLSGVPLATIAFQVAVTTMDGVLLYAALRVTGTLWVPIVLHALSDYARWLVAPGDDGSVSPLAAASQIAMSVLALAVVISVILEDRRSRRVARTAG